METIKLYFRFVCLCMKKASERTFHFADAVFGGIGLTIVTLATGWMGIKVPVPEGNQYAEQYKQLIFFVAIVIVTWLIRFLNAPFFIWKDQIQLFKSSNTLELKEREIAAQEAHTRELRLQRIQKERDNNPIVKAMRQKQEAAFGIYAKPDLSINLGQGQRFEETRNSHIYYLNRLLSICIKNEGNISASNCKFFIDIQKPDGTFDSQLITEPFTLNSGEQKFIPIVSYDEAIADHTQPVKVIRLCVRHGGFHNSAGDLSYDAAHLITLRITSLELPAVEVMCKVRIENGKLKLDKA